MGPPAGECMVETPPGHLSAINPTPAGTTALTAPGRDEHLCPQDLPPVYHPPRRKSK